jgi:hypothetical protein
MDKTLAELGVGKAVPCLFRDALVEECQAGWLVLMLLTVRLLSCWCLETEHETEVSCYNAAQFAAFKTNPQMKW